jgi:hypothetical protein
LFFSFLSFKSSHGRNMEWVWRPVTPCVLVPCKSASARMSSSSLPCPTHSLLADFLY